MESSPTMPPLASLAPFDSCATLLDQGPHLMTAERLLETMDRYGIAEALVHESNARLIYPREDSNYRLLKLIKDRPRLHPTWVVEPPRRPGSGPAEVLVQEMLDAGVRAVRWPLKRIPPMLWLWQDLAHALREWVRLRFLQEMFSNRNCEWRAGGQ